MRTAGAILLIAAIAAAAAAPGAVRAKPKAIGLAVGGKVTFGEGYPGWKPNLESPMLAKAREVWQRVHGAAPRFEVIHAGLECGILGEKLPGIDMISLGPTIENPHSPDERVSIPDVARFFDFMRAFLPALVRD